MMMACIAGESDGWFLGYNKLGSLTHTDTLQLVRGDGRRMMMMMMMTTTAATLMTC
jgi:hypothetical protein